jgi:hypothetical protein
MIDQRTDAHGLTPIRIGYCLSLTGPLPDNSRSARLAHDIWREDVNTRGGVLGRPVELIRYDDHGDASVADCLDVVILKLLLGDHCDRDRHRLEVFRASSGGDGDFLQFLLGCGRIDRARRDLRLCRCPRQKEAPTRRKPRIKRCETCSADVRTPTAKCMGIR